MKFSCPNCNLEGKIDDAKLPEKGIYAGCPKCKTRFLVKKETLPNPPHDLPEHIRPPASPSPETQTPVGRETSETVKERSDQPPGRERPAAARNFRPPFSSPRSDLANFIGNNADKYLRKFAGFNTTGTDSFALTWHWPAFFVPFWWLLYRKQYAWAVLAFFICFVPFGGFLSMFAFGMTANYIYYTYSKRKLLEIDALSSEMSKAVEIARAGGVNNLIWVVAPLLGIFFIGIISAIAIPQFAAYRAKAFNAMAITELRNARTSVDNYYMEHKAYPDALEQTEYRKTEKVEVRFADLQADRYTIVAAHQNGDKEYATRSDSPSLLYRFKRDQTGEFVPLE